ncbi:2Fe-2S iron-sulfur cluster-binding protein [Halohasta litorea]|uniref:2Fe-2S iron-sulfur cluster-binding protein n=1 Tax=Halohasta litorea TaxID=869891 RepID=A0ABD6D5Y4_9EURY|nr:2Fe-2S iron-sulfur cluster-binding protein [Halohasta litorea]
MGETDGSETVRVIVVDGETETELVVERGRVLREVLLEAGFSPYSRLTDRANCGGRGLCATCGVRLVEAVEPEHWHDRLAERFGYPRLSCQIAAERDLRVSLINDKIVWGRRRSE